MKSISIFLIAVALIVGMVGCGGNGPVDNPPTIDSYSIPYCAESGTSFHIEVTATDDYGLEGVYIELQILSNGSWESKKIDLGKTNGLWEGTYTLPESQEGMDHEYYVIAVDTDNQKNVDFDVVKGSIFCTAPHLSCDCDCQQTTPGGDARYSFEDPQLLKYEVVFNWTDTPGKNNVDLYAVLLQFQFNNGGKGDVGPRIEFNSSSNTTEKKVIFSIESMNDEEYTAHPYPPDCPDCDYVDDEIEGKSARCVISYDWIEGNPYKITVQKDDEGPVDEGVVWNATITKDPGLETAVETLIGRIKLDDQPGYEDEGGYGLLQGQELVGFWKYYLGGSNNQCLEADHVEIIRIGPIATDRFDDKWLPRVAFYEHTPCIRETTNSTKQGVIVQEFGAGVVERGPEEPLLGVLWDTGHDVPLSYASQELQDLFE